MGRGARFHAVPARCGLLWYIQIRSIQCIHIWMQCPYQDIYKREHMSSDLGKKVREIREAEGLGRQAFCGLVDVPKQTLINVEMGRSGPSGKLLAEVSKAFSKYTLWLMTDQTDEANGQVSPREENTKRMSMPDSIEYIGKYSLIEIRDVLKKNMKDRGITTKQIAKETGLSEKDLNEFFNRPGNIVKDKECELKAYIYLMQSDFLDKSLLERINSVSYVISERLPG